MYDAPVEAFDEYNGTTDEVHQSVRAGTRQSIGVVHDAPVTASASTRTIVRRLTPLECERLMGWPDGYTAHGITDDGEHVNIANTNRYRICGNGIVATVTEWIGNRLADAVAEQQMGAAA